LSSNTRECIYAKMEGEILTFDDALHLVELNFPSSSSFLLPFLWFPSLPNPSIAFQTSLAQ